MIKAVLFDLDGTLLPMDEEVFTKGFFGILCKKFAEYGYDKEKLVHCIWQAKNLMCANDGSQTNEELFWKVFAEHFGEEKLKDRPLFEKFYSEEFKLTKSFCGSNKQAQKALAFAKQKGLRTILASNPIFPRAGMITRISFVGLTEQDFDYITSYENCTYCKPNPKYYEEILRKNGLTPEEVIMFGNSEKEDYLPATSVGIQTYLLSEEETPKKDLISQEDMSEIIKDL